MFYFSVLWKNATIYFHYGWCKKIPSLLLSSSFFLFHFDVCFSFYLFLGDFHLLNYLDTISLPSLPSSLSKAIVVSLLNNLLRLLPFSASLTRQWFNGDSDADDKPIADWFGGYYYNRKFLPLATKTTYT